MFHNHRLAVAARDGRGRSTMGSIIFITIPFQYMQINNHIVVVAEWKTISALNVCALHYYFGKIFSSVDCLSRCNKIL